MSNLELIEITVTCTTLECENAGVTLSVQAAAGGMVMCGPCGTILATNVTQEAQ